MTAGTRPGTCEVVEPAEGAVASTGEGARTEAPSSATTRPSAPRGALRPMRHAPSTSLLAALLLASCAGPAGTRRVELYTTPEDFGIVRTPVEGPLGGHPAQGAPIPLPGRGVHLIPFVRTEHKTWFHDGDHFDEGGRSADRFTRGYQGRSMSAEVRWHNAVLRVAETGEQWPLLERRGVISRLWIQVAPESGKGNVAQGLLFAVTLDDTNGDGVLDDRDGARVVATGPEGRDPRVVTPLGTHLDDVDLDAGEGGVTLFLREDRDGNGRFAATELPVPYFLAPGEARAVRVVDEATLEAMEAPLR